MMQISRKMRIFAAFFEKERNFAAFFEKMRIFAAFLKKDGSSCLISMRKSG